MSTDDLPTAYPLQWPAGRARTIERTETYAFRKQQSRQRHSVWESCSAIIGELRKMDADSVVISTNLRVRLDGLPYSDQRTPADSGVAVYFLRAGQNVCFACDKWTQVEDNLWAIFLTLEALRGVDRWGAANMAASFTGYLALPAPAVDPSDDWWLALNVSRNASAEEIRSAYRMLAKRYHPDVAGTAFSQDWLLIQAAYETAQRLGLVAA